MMENKMVGSKTGQGFIKRRKRNSDFRFRHFGIQTKKSFFATLELTKQLINQSIVLKFL
jgi:hypothetical protein